MYEHTKKDRKRIEYPFNVTNNTRISKECYDIVFSQLSERNQKIIEYYFRDFKTYKEIAEIFNVTPERIRQLINLAVWQVKKGITLCQK